MYSIGSLLQNKFSASLQSLLSDPMSSTCPPDPGCSTDYLLPDPEYFTFRTTRPRVFDSPYYQTQDILLSSLPDAGNFTFLTTRPKVCYFFLQQTLGLSLSLTTSHWIFYFPYNQTPGWVFHFIFYQTHGFFLSLLLDSGFL